MTGLTVARHGSSGRGPRSSSGRPPRTSSGRPPRDARSQRDLRRRQLGQNFLTDDHVATRILDLAAVVRGDLVVEFGAGRGALTRPLLDRGARVIAVELDPSWVTALRRDLGGRPDLEVVAGDALEVALPTEAFRVVANPPFGATTAILRRLLGGDVPLVDATLLLQLQTARRVSGAPAAGRFSLGWAPWFELTVHDRVPREVFRPVPATDAAILQVRPRPVPWLSPARFAEWDAFVERVFGASGRTAADRLDVALGPKEARTVSRAANVDTVRPPSRLPVEAWLALFRALPRRDADR